MSKRDDWSWSVEALYACPCGSLVATRRWRWIDREARPDLAATVRASGPLVGACSRCRRPVRGGGAWLEVAPDRGAATLVLSDDRRGDLIAALQAHLGELPARGELIAPWLLQPAVAFAPTPTPTPSAEMEREIGLRAWPGDPDAPEAAREAPDPAHEAPAPPVEPARYHRPQVEGAPAPAAVVIPPAEPAQVRAGAPVGGRDREPEPAARSGAVLESRADQPGPRGQVVSGRVDGTEGTPPPERADRREGSGPTGRAQAAAEPGRRREGSGPTEVGSEARSPARPGSRPAERAPSHDSSLQDTFPGRRSPRTQEHEPPEPGPEGERAALRAAVARALVPGPATGRGEGGPRPAVVLPNPRAGDPAGAEASAADSGTFASKRQAGEGAASDSGTSWPKRQTGEGAASDSGTSWPKRQVGEEAEAAPRGSRPPPAPGRAAAPPSPPPPRLGPDVQRAGLAALGSEGGAVQVSAIVNEATARVWATAPVKVRPIHLRGLGYPLVGVRCVAEVGGEPVILDAVVDVAEEATLEIFKQLTREFRVRLTVRTGDGAPAGRELAAPELQRNAATCLESAQAQLGTGEFPPDAYRSAREVLAGRSAAQRLDPARIPLAEALAESCRESASAAWTALERLDQASKKENLARLIEIDGLPLPTYEKVRSAVLAAAIEFGLPAPARFWRRWLGSEQAKDIGAFVQRLTAARTASIARGEDLTAEQVEAAWRGLLDLCQHKNLTPPPELSKALGLGKVSTGRRASQPQIKVASEVREAPAPQEARTRSPARRRELAAKLRGRPSEGDIRAVLGALAELSEEEAVALLPALAELGARVVPELIAALRAPQRQQRQAAAIVLGQFGERKAEGPLLAMLGDEPSVAWVDAARALGNLGPRVVGPLCTLIRSAPAGRKDVVGGRVARALAELVRAEGAGPGGSGRQTIENLLDVGDPSVSSAARRALATLEGVREEVDGDDAEASRRFSELASDAFAPELDAAADDELDEVDVEVGD